MVSECRSCFPKLDFDSSQVRLRSSRNLSPVSDGNIRLRAIHAADGVGAVDIAAIAADGSATPLYTGVDFGVVGDYLEVPAIEYTIGFDVNADATSDLYCDVPALPAGTIANVFAVLDGDEFFLLAQLDGAQ